MLPRSIANNVCRGELIQALADHHYLAASVSQPMAACGNTFKLTDSLPTRLAAPSVRSLITVHGMVAHAIARWGKKERNAHWLAKLVSGESLAAFALTEPNVGSDAREVATSAVRQNDSFVLNGEKKWITGDRLPTCF